MARLSCALVHDPDDLIDVGEDGTSTVTLVVGGEAFRRAYRSADRQAGAGMGQEGRGGEARRSVAERADLLCQLGCSVEKDTDDRAMRSYRLASDLGQTAADFRLGPILIVRGRA